LVGHEVIVKLISATTTRKGSKATGATGYQSVPIRLTRDDFHGEWNDTIAPNTT
jgi:hypothetical protein